MNFTQSFQSFLTRTIFAALVATLVSPTASAQPEEKQRKTIPMPQDLPALSEIDALHAPGDTIRRYFLTSQGMRGQTISLEDTGGWFCTLSQDTHVMLDYWPTLGHWAFQVGFNEEAELTAGGLATCHEISTGRSKQ